MGMPGGPVTPKIGTREPDTQGGRYHPLDVMEFNANEAKKKSYGDEL